MVSEGDTKLNTLNEFNMYLVAKVIGDKKEYYECVGSLDIETTEFTTEEGKIANYCYLWSFSIDGLLFRYGRDPEEFFQFLEELKLEKKLIIYVQWLGFEYYNLKWLFDKYITDTKVEFKDSNMPKRITGNKVVFKCSYLLSNLKLKDMGREIGLPKLNMDYYFPRTRNTVLSNDLIRYSLRDVEIVCKWILNLANILNVPIHELPITPAGYYKLELAKHNYGYGFRKKVSQGRYFPENGENGWKEDDFDKFKEALKGGLIVYNDEYIEETIKDVIHADIKSAYSYVQVVYPFPYKFSHEYNDNSKSKQRMLIEDIGNWAVLAKFTFTDLDLKEDANCDFLKVRDKCPLETYSAYMTNIEFKMIELFYDFSSVEWEDLQATKMRRLDNREIKTIFDLFDLKESSKGTSSYVLNKRRLNSGYGNKCMRMDKYNLTADKCNFYYPEGVWVTAIQRSIMATLIWKLGEDFIYCNTDSIFCKNTERARKVLEDYNNTIPFEKLGRFETELLKKFYLIAPSRYIRIFDDNRAVVTLSGANQKDVRITLEDFINYSEGGTITIKNGTAKIDKAKEIKPYKGKINGEEVVTYSYLTRIPLDVNIRKIDKSTDIIMEVD